MKTVTLKTHIIRRAQKEDIDSIIKYIAIEWNPTHIFVKNRDFFEYEHCPNGEVNAILAENIETNKIDAILLMYPIGKKMEGNDFFGGIWSVSKRCKTPMLGIKLLQNVLKITGAKSHSGVGININTTAKIFAQTKEQRLGKMKHYYMLNDLSEYKIAIIKEKKIVPVKNGNVEFIKFSNIEDLKKAFFFEKYKEQPFYKDANYINHRYFKHPVYNYEIFGIKFQEKIDSIIITRYIKCNSARIMRIIDFLGEESILKECGMNFREIIDKDKLEYIDFYEHGIDDNILQMGGFVLKEREHNIIPNYFEPYVSENIDLWFHTPYNECRIFKGDGDQDRPNYFI